MTNRITLSIEQFSHLHFTFERVNCIRFHKYSNIFSIERWNKPVIVNLKITDRFLCPSIFKNQSDDCACFFIIFMLVFSFLGVAAFCVVFGFLCIFAFSVVFVFVPPLVSESVFKKSTSKEPTKDVLKMGLRGYDSEFNPIPHKNLNVFQCPGMQGANNWYKHLWRVLRLGV